MKPPFAFADHSGWFFNFEHPREQERGLDFTEDLYCPGRFNGVLAPGQTITLIATVETELPDEPDDCAEGGNRPAESAAGTGGRPRRATPPAKR